MAINGVDHSDNITLIEVVPAANDSFRHNNPKMTFDNPNTLIEVDRRCPISVADAMIPG